MSDILARYVNPEITEVLEILDRNLNILKGKRIKMEYNGRILIDKVDPSPEEIMSALYSGGINGKCN